MRKINIKTTVVAMAIGATAMTGCSKFLDVNQNGNLPEKVDPNLILPTTEATIAHVVGNNLHQYGSFWAQYFTQNPGSSQYKVLDQYMSVNSSFDRQWGLMYSNAMTDLKNIIKLSSENTDYRLYGAMANIMLAYDLQLLTDGFGDIPYTEAGQGSENITPKYESQKAIYDSIFSLIDKGIASFAEGGVITPKKEDLIFGGDINAWVAFANTLKLRACMRLSYQPEAQEMVEAALQSLEGKTFLTQDAKIEYYAAGGFGNPFYEEMLGLGKTQNVVGSATVVNQLNANNDPRVGKFFQLNKDTVYMGIPQGSYNTTEEDPSFPTAAIAGDAQDINSATAPVKLMSASESYFLQAEAVARGLMSSGDAKDLFEKGIKASFDAYEVSSADAEAYLQNEPVAQFPTSDINAQVKAIITQKYFAMCGNQSFEAWTEWRRTGFPDFFVMSEVGSLGGKFPTRFLYPNNELVRNPNTPKGVSLSDKVWWDVKD